MLSAFYFIHYGIILNYLLVGLFILILISTFFIIILRDIIHIIFFYMFICLYMTELSILLNMEFLALNFIIIYLGAICVLILFQAKLVKLLTEKNNKIILNSFLFIPCLFIFLFFPIMQFISIYFSTYEFELLNLNNLNYFADLIYINWFDKFKNINTLVVLGIYLYQYNFINILIGSLVLLIAMIGAIILTLTQTTKQKLIKIV